MENNNYDYIKQRLYGILISDRIQMNGDELSINHVINALTSTIGNFNESFISEGKKIIKKSKNNIFTKHPEVENIYFTITQKGDAIIEIRFNDSTKRMHNLVFSNAQECRYRSIFNNADGSIINKVQSFAEKYASVFESLILKLEYFHDKYPDLDYSWSAISDRSDESKVQTVGDDFISCNIDLDKITSSERPHVFLKKYCDSSSDVCEKVDFYNEEVAAKTRININDLNPTIKYFTYKYYGLDKQKELVK